MDIPLSSVNLSNKEVEYVLDALNTGWISGTGDYLKRFEDSISERVGRSYAIAVANGTLALELILRALEVGAGDEVIVPALTFVAPAAAVSTVGGTPVFADITTSTWTIDVEDVAKKITPKTKAIIAVDVLGHPSDYDSLSAFGIPVIEDAAEAHGALYRNKPVGQFGIASIFSFHANKAITTGEGGCVLTDDESLMKKMRLIANHGMTKEKPYWHEIIGHNYRMTNLTAAVGLGQMDRWDELIQARNIVANKYDELLKQLSLTRRPVASWAKEACWLYTVTVEKRDKVLAFLHMSGVDARAIWYSLPELPIYKAGCRGEYPIARRISSTAIWLPTWANMPDSSIERVALSLETVLQQTGI